MRFSAGLENPGLKPIREKGSAFPLDEVQLPLLKQGPYRGQRIVSDRDL